MIDFDHTKGYWVYRKRFGLLEHIQKGQTVTYCDYSDFEVVDIKPHSQWNTWAYGEYIMTVRRIENE